MSALHDAVFTMSDPPFLPVAEKRAAFRISHGLAGVQGIWLGCAIVLAMVWGGLAWMVQHDSMRLARQQETQVTLEANGFADYVALHLLLIDRVMMNLRQDYQETGAFPLRESVTPELGESAALLRQVAIADAAGKFVASTAISFSGISISDRGYFRAVAARPTDRLHISDSLVAGKLTGKMALQLTRPILSEQGEFLGAIVASIDPVTLRRYFAGSDVFDQQGLVTIVGRDDGIVRVRFARDSITSGDSFLLSPGWKDISTQVAGSDRAPSLLDGVERRSAFHQVGTYPLVVRVSIPTEQVWSLADGHFQFALATAVAFSFALIMLARARVRLEAEQEESFRRMAASRQKELEANQMKSQVPGLGVARTAHPAQFDPRVLGADPRRGAAARTPASSPG